jgi:cytochrome c peroxidase
MLRHFATRSTCALLLLLSAACSDEPTAPSREELIAQLRTAAAAAALATPPTPATASPEALALGQALFTSKLLSGNRDTSCATCHDPLFATTDALSLSIGTGGIGRGPNRQLTPYRRLHPRNAPDLFLRATDLQTTLLRDGGATRLDDGTFTPPEEAEQPYREGVAGLVSAVALFHVTQRFDMRGNAGENAIDGTPNEIAAIDEDDWHSMWDALAVRLREDATMRPLIAAAFPGEAPESISLERLFSALEAFAAQAFDSRETPFDSFLAGDDSALSDQALRGALLFSTSAGCTSCHNGPLLADNAFHNLGVPFIGLGQEYEEPYDFGRASQTERTTDRYAFATAPLRNTSATGPWMHNGAYTSLEAAVRHHLDPRDALLRYDWQQLDPLLQSTWRGAPIDNARLLSTLDPLVATPVTMTDRDFDDLIAFLREGLTDADALARIATIQAP